MIRLLLLATALLGVNTAFAQLSDGEGHMITLPGKQFSCFLPQHFEVQENPPGVIHKVSGTFVIVVKMPSQPQQQQQRMTAQGGLPRSFFEDPRYEITDFREESAVSRQSHSQSSDKTYWMEYSLQGHSFGRYTTLKVHGQDQYLIIGNYPVVFQDQVLEEVKKIMSSFVIH